MSQLRLLCPFLDPDKAVTLYCIQQEHSSCLCHSSHFVSTCFILSIMYLLVYPALSTPRRPQAATPMARPVAVGVDFVTPDGMVVPRALGEAALLGRTAVLVGGLLVGIWPQAQ